MKTRLVQLLFALTLVMVSTDSREAEAAYAEGRARPVDIWIANMWLDHTYHYYDGYGWATFGGGTSGGNLKHSTGSIYSNEWNCMAQTSNLTYGVTGVCHQGTNRGLERTAIPYVDGWSDVGGSGTSYSMYGRFGAWFPFGPSYGAPC